MNIVKALSVSAAAALLLCGAAQAGELTDLPSAQPLPLQQSPQANKGPALGIGVICNTSQQAEQYVSLRAKGQGLTPAMTTVNRKADQPRACGLAAIAYMRGRTLDTKPLNGKLVQIVRIKVFAGYNGRHWHHIADTVQYAVFRTKGMAI
ncbi:MAG: hypothetical protein P8Y71_06645 [Pseudolabrys sp.]